MELFAAVERNDVDTVKALIFGGGVDINFEDAFGNTALIQATRNGYLNCAKVLLEAKADVNKKTANGSAPIHFASWNGRVEILKLLIVHNANIHLKRTFHGQEEGSPLYHAASYGCRECLKELIRAGADPDGRNMNNGRTPLATAIDFNKISCAEMLLYAGAKMSNVKADIEIPDWMKKMVAKRQRALESTWALLGVLRKRFGNHFHKDLVKPLGMMLWSTRLDERWEKK
jgi:ankyrin repeat protein